MFFTKTAQTGQTVSLRLTKWLRELEIDKKKLLTSPDSKLFHTNVDHLSKK